MWWLACWKHELLITGLKGPIQKRSLRGYQKKLVGAVSGWCWFLLLHRCRLQQLQWMGSTTKTIEGGVCTKDKLSAFYDSIIHDKYYVYIIYVICAFNVTTYGLLRSLGAESGYHSWQTLVNLCWIWGSKSSDFTMPWRHHSPVFGTGDAKKESPFCVWHLFKGL